MHPLVDRGTATWVDLAQIASGVAALAAVWLSVVTARSARRVPMTDAYLEAWQSILDVLAVATERRKELPSVEEADALMRQYRAADHKLSVIEATLRVRVYGREIRHQLKNLLLDVLFDDPEIREAPEAGFELTLAITPKADWATCSDEDWLRVMNSVPISSLFASDATSPPGDLDDSDGLIRWYFPTVLSGLNARESVTAPTASPQQQLAFMLGAYVDAFVLPWIRDASREALLGRLDLKTRAHVWRSRRRGWRYGDRPWRRTPTYPLTLFEPTRRRG